MLTKSGKLSNKYDIVIETELSEDTSNVSGWCMKMTWYAMYYVCQNAKQCS